MKQKDWYKDLDFWGFTASMLCAIHCAALPLLVTLSVAGNLSLLSDPYWEFAFLSGSALLAILSLLPGRRTHQNWAPLLLALLGFAAILCAHGQDFLHGHHHEAPSWVAALGGLLIAGAHWLNWRLLRECRSCSLD